MNFVNIMESSSPVFDGNSFDVESCFNETMEFLIQDKIFDTEFRIKENIVIKESTDCTLINESVDSIIENFKKRLMSIIKFIRKQANKFFNSVSKFIGNNKHIISNIDYLALNGKKFTFSGRRYDFSLVNEINLNPLIELRDAIERVRSFSSLDCENIDSMIKELENEFDNFKVDSTTLSVIRGKIVGLSGSLDKAKLVSFIKGDIIDDGSETVEQSDIDKIKRMFTGKYSKMDDKITKLISRVESIYNSIINSLSNLKSSVCKFAEKDIENGEKLLVIANTYINMVINYVTSINADIMIVTSTLLQSLRQMIIEMNKTALTIITTNKKEAKTNE